MVIAGSLAIGGLETTPSQAQSTTSSKADFSGLPKTSRKTPPKGTRVDVDADQIVFDERTGEAIATGDVVFTYGNYILIARRVVYNRHTDTMRAEGEIRMREPGGNILEADILQLQNRFRDGFAEHLRLLLTNEAIVTANYAKRRDGYLTTYERTAYTRCRSCVTDSGTPAWNLVASETVHDEQEATIAHKNARLEVLGVPIFYWPYLSHPDPTVERASGWLIPRFSFSSVFGYGYAQPYFWNIAPNADLTILPKVTSKQGPLLGAKFRHRLAKGEYSIEGVGVYQLNPDDLPAPGNERLRGWLRTMGEFHINRRWRWGWDGTIVSDDTFGREYDFDERTEIANFIYLDGVHDRNYATFRAYNFTGLLATDRQNTFPTAAPYFRHDYIFDFSVFGGELGLNTDVYSLYRDRSFVAYDTTPHTFDVVQGTRQLRATSQLHWRKEIVTDPGVIITPFGRLRGDLLLSDNVPSQAPGNLPLYGEVTDTRLLPSGGVDIRAPFVRGDELGTHVLTPIAQIIASSNEGDLSGWGNEDAISLNFATSNLFLENRFTGNDRYEGGTRVNAGLLYTLGLANGSSINASIGQTYHVAGANSFVLGSGLDETISDLVAAVWIQPYENFTASYQVRLDPEELDIREHDVGIAATFSRLKTALNYVRVDEAEAYGRPPDLEQIWGLAEFDVGKGISLFGGGRYDVGNDKFIDRFAGVGFDCDCARVRLLYKEEFLTDRNLVRTDRSCSMLNWSHLAAHHMDRACRVCKETNMNMLRSGGPAKTGFTTSTMAVALLLFTGCGQQVDLYDYFGDDTPATSPSANAGQSLTPPGQNIGGAQPANALAGNTAFGATDVALESARPFVGGIQKVSLKDAQGVAVTVDDLPVTNFDISQRINLENALGARLRPDLSTQKNVLTTLVNEKVAKSNAKKRNYQVKDKELDERIDNMVGRMKIPRADLQKRLAEKGVDESTLKTQIEGTLYIRWVMAQQNVDTDIVVDQALVDAKYKEILEDPRMKPVTVVTIRQVDLPIGRTTEAMRQQLMYARSIESQQIMQRYKGCNTIKAASKDVFNVQIGKPIEADLSKLPPELQKALRGAGTRKLIGPIPGPTGIRLFANCGTKKISPPLPDRKQIEARVRSEQFDALVSQAMAEARKESFIDYKDPEFRP